MASLQHLPGVLFEKTYLRYLRPFNMSVESMVTYKLKIEYTI